MITKKNIALCVIFSIITCGLYSIYWFICLTDDSNVLANDYKTSGGVAFFLTLITCGLYGLYWAYRMGEKIDTAKTSRGIPASNSGILYLILALLSFGLISYILMQYELNKLA